MRKIINWNKQWIFIKEEEAVQVDLPHTWNAVDGQDGGNDYYRGTCIYKKRFERPQMCLNDQVYLEFRGANSSAEVWVNGQILGSHDGGYSTFRVNITSALKDQNEVCVAVNNAANRTVYPQKADFTFYGGLYRDVYMIIVPESHFDLDNWGSSGIKVTPEINGNDAEVRVEAFVTGQAEYVRLEIEGAGYTQCPVTDGKAEGVIEIKDAHLWKGRKDPYLYLLKAQLIVDNMAVDSVDTSFGCRTFHFDREKGFYLNGESYPLRGVSRHQDRKGVGNALTKAMHKEDMEIIAEMGANTIRLAHYQHDQYFYDLCDAYGMIVWAEIPYISEHMPEARQNTVTQMKELVCQNYNHPSIICWGLSNEITVTKMSEDLVDNHRILNDLVHQLDKTRPTAMAHVIMLDIQDPILEIPDIHSYNLYYGWYFGELEDNDEWFDQFHETHPDKVIGLSEYGADASPKWQSLNPERGDYSEQYQCIYHEHILKVIETRPYIWATHVWNMFDFGADGREEGGELGLNQKGLVTFDRKLRKDAFYLYKAYLSDEPFIHICSRRYVDRTEVLSEIKVYSNQKKVALYNNGKLVAEQEGSKVFLFQVKLETEHQIEARSGALYDQINIRKVEQANPAYTLPNTGIHNWFDEPGMAFPAGYLSIKETLGTIKKSEEGEKLVHQVIAQASKKRGDVAQGLERNEAMERMMNKMTLESLLKQAGDAVPKEMVVSLNQKLNLIRKTN